MRIKEFVRARILPAVNAAMAPLSLRLVPASTPNRDFSDFIRHLRRIGHEPRTLIDVGVAQGTPGLYNELRGAALYLVEPVPACGPILDRLARQYGGTSFNVAAGSYDGTVVLNVHDTPSGSSIYAQWEGKEMDGTPTAVPIRRLDTLITSELPRPALLKIDTQGHEIDAIKGADGILDQIDLIILECSMHQFRKGAPEAADVVRFMQDRGFALYETLEGHYRAYDGAMAQVDMVFVPEGSPLRAVQSYFSADQARAYLKR